MARYSKGDPREGGYYALWAKQWLDDEKLKSISKELKCCFSEVMACAQLVDFVTGRLEHGGFIHSKESICARAGISMPQLNQLLELGLIGEDKIGCIFITNWDKWQSPESKKAKYQINSGLNPQLNSGLNPKLNPDLIGGLKASVHSSEHKAKTTPAPKGASKGNGNTFAGSGMTEEEFKKAYPVVYERLKADNGHKPIDIDF